MQKGVDGMSIANSYRRWMLIPLLPLVLTACAGRARTGDADPSPFVKQSNLQMPYEPPISPDPWMKYLTAVNPGGTVRFVSADVGWRVEGQTGAAYIDRILTAGPKGTTWDWPGSSVGRSADGGSSWSTVYARDDGIWGVDALSSDEAWAVGVTTLASTRDAGATWQELGEPSDGSLVSVDFVSDAAGFGLTTDGQLVQTTDGGQSWVPGALQPAASDLCFASSKLGYALAQDGSIHMTSDGGATWTKVSDSPFDVDLAPYWGQLACGDNDVWASLQVVDQAAHLEGSPYAVSYSPDEGAHWSVVAANNIDPPVSIPGAPTPMDEISQLVAGPPGMAFLIGFSDSRWELDTQQLVGGSLGVSAAFSSLPSGKSQPGTGKGLLIIHGSAFSGSHGWVFLDDDAVGSPDSPESQALVLGSDDSGKTWTIVSEDEPQSPPPPSN